MAPNSVPPSLKTAEEVSIKASKDMQAYASVAPYLVVTCSDFRLHDEVTRFLEARGLRDQYDKIALPGASIGVHNHKFPSWSQSFFEQFRILKAIHHIEHVMIIDHLDCGMFKHVVGKEYTKTQEHEKCAHEEQLKKVAELIHEKYPSLWVEGLIMGIDGRVSTVIEFHIPEPAGE